MEIEQNAFDKKIEIEIENENDPIPNKIDQGSNQQNEVILI